MSTERDVELVLEDWLAAGIDEMPDRVYRTILDRVERQPQQRALRVTWRDSRVNTVYKPLIGIAAVVVIAVIGITALQPAVGGLDRATPSVSLPPSPVSSASSAPTAPPAPTIPVPPTLGAAIGAPGTAVDVADFSEPFGFTVPAFPPDAPSPAVLALWDPVGDGPEDAPRKAARIVSNTWGSVSFHDDTSLPSDMCQPSSERIPDVPATPPAVGDWLDSSAGLDVSAPVELPVDGRTALRWDVATPVGVCGEQAIQPPPWFGAGERHRIYAVPTRTDTILVITWGVNWSEGSDTHLDAVNAATDDLVRSMRFEG